MHIGIIIILGFIFVGVLYTLIREKIGEVKTQKAFRKSKEKAEAIQKDIERKRYISY